MEMENINDFKPNTLSFGKSPKGDFYLHMKGTQEGVDDVICYRDVALGLLKDISTLSDTISVPDYKSLEAGKKEPIALNGYELELNLDEGYLRESKGRNVFTFKAFTVTSEPVVMIDNTLSEDLEEIKIENSKLKEKNSELEGLLAEKVREIDSLQAKIVELQDALLADQKAAEPQVSPSETASNGEEFEIEVTDSDNLTENSIGLEEDVESDIVTTDVDVDDADVVDAISNAEVENSVTLNDGDIEFGADIDFGEGSPEDFAMSIMSIEGNDTADTYDSDETHDPSNEDPFESSEKALETKPSNQVKPISTPSIGVKPIGKISVGLGKPKVIVTETDNTQKVVEESSPNTKDSSENKPEAIKPALPKFSAPKIGGIKVPKLNISAPKMGGM